MSDHTEVRRLSPDELRTLFLFESLTDEQLQWLSESGYVESAHDGIVFNEGDEATCCYVLLSGEIRLCKLSHGEEIEINRTGQRGVYSGAFNAFFGANDHKLYAVNASTGSVICSYLTPGNISSSPTVIDPDGNGLVVYFGENGRRSPL